MISAGRHLYNASISANAHSSCTILVFLSSVFFHLAFLRRTLCRGFVLERYYAHECRNDLYEYLRLVGCRHVVYDGYAEASSKSVAEMVLISNIDESLEACLEGGIRCIIVLD